MTGQVTRRSHHPFRLSWRRRRTLRRLALPVAGAATLAVTTLSASAPYEHAHVAGFVDHTRVTGVAAYTGPAAFEAHMPVAGFEDYTRSAGTMADGELRVRLDAGAATWRPWGDDGPALLAFVFAADGEAPRVPAPLIRVTAGTPVVATVRNGFDAPLVLRGFTDRLPQQGPRPPGPPGPPAEDSVVVDAGMTVDVRFTPQTPGTYVFRGQLRGEVTPPPGVLHSAEGAERAFIGVLIVDPPQATSHAGERIFLITHWMDPAQPASFLPATRFFINGRSWPHTERLSVAQHDTVRWRVINFSGRPHPMHLHGFHFSVDARGDLLHEQVYTPAERRLVVTEVLAPAQTMRMHWVAHEPGNWVFHCHLMRHMSGVQLAPLDGSIGAEQRPVDGSSAGHHRPADRTEPANQHADELMGGLVLGITVRPSPAWTPDTMSRRRRLDLHITRRAGVFGEEAGYAFVLQQGAPPAPDSVHFPGSVLELQRGEPTEIVVHNRSDVPLGVHWHGLELESRSDGVPGWSGLPGSIVPAIAPGDSLRVRMTPPRAGTFMYHVHSEPGHQLAQGLYGPLLVREAAGSGAAARDLLFLLGSLGTGDDPPPAINGTRHPDDVRLQAGTTYRFRFMHISPDDEKRVSLESVNGGASWRWVAKDGAELPLHQQRERDGDVVIHVGETYDFEWRPEPGDYRLRVVSTFDRGAPLFPRPAPPPDTTHVRISVR